MTTENSSPVILETLPAGNGLSVAVATLNAPKSINSLTREMVDILLPQLQQWESDPTIACVLMRGAEDRGFCAGGDVVKLRDSSVAGDGEAARFFEQEYRLDYLIHVYKKPILVWGHGIVMGGGLGLMAGASHRVVTAKTRLAMPEVTIGLYPDVGGTWFLNRMPGRTGLFIALTGVAINAGDTLYLGLADYFLQHDQWQQVVDGACAIEWSLNDSHAQLSGLLKGLSAEAGDPPSSSVREHFDQIQSLTHEPDLLSLFDSITSYDGDDEWLQGAAKTLRNGCPASVWVIYEQLKRCRHFSLKEVFEAELVLSANCMNFPNFAEGVRALLVDKDRKPAFTPSEVKAVEADFVAQHFVSPWSGANPLSDL